MKFSLWNNEAEFIQASDNQDKLRASAAQVRAWHQSMGSESNLGNLTIKENARDAVVATAIYRHGMALRWKSAA